MRSFDELERMRKERTRLWRQHKRKLLSIMKRMRQRVFNGRGFIGFKEDMLTFKGPRKLVIQFEFNQSKEDNSWDLILSLWARNGNLLELVTVDVDPDGDFDYVEEALSEMIARYV